jgi:hypothetical protein
VDFYVARGEIYVLVESDQGWDAGGLFGYIFNEMQEELIYHNDTLLNS